MFVHGRCLVVHWCMQYTADSTLSLFLVQPCNEVCVCVCIRQFNTHKHTPYACLQHNVWLAKDNGLCLATSAQSFFASAHPSLGVVVAGLHGGTQRGERESIICSTSPPTLHSQHIHCSVRSCERIEVHYQVRYGKAANS